MSTIGTRLKLLRGGQSLEIFSNKLGIHRVTLSRFEKNERIPDAIFIQAVVEQTGVCSEWLIMGTEPMYKSSGENLYQDRDLKPCEFSQSAENIDTTPRDDLYHDRGTASNELLPHYLKALEATAALQRELTDSIRENADLRVELERQKAQVRDLEREKAALAQKIQEIQQTATEITDMSVVRLAHENEELKSQLARLNRLGIFDEPDTRMPQAGVQDRK